MLYYDNVSASAGLIVGLTAGLASLVGIVCFISFSVIVIVVYLRAKNKRLSTPFINSGDNDTTDTPTQVVSFTTQLAPTQLEPDNKGALSAYNAVYQPSAP